MNYKGLIKRLALPDDFVVPTRLTHGGITAGSDHSGRSP